jgi:hypothetical protein
MINTNDPLSDIDFFLRQRRNRHIPQTGWNDKQRSKMCRALPDREGRDHVRNVNRRIAKSRNRQAHNKQSVRNRLCMWHRRNSGGMSATQVHVNNCLLKFFKMVACDWFWLSPGRSCELQGNFEMYMDLLNILLEGDAHRLPVTQVNVDFMANLSRLTLTFKFGNVKEIADIFQTIKFAKPRDDDTGINMRLLMSGIEQNPGPDESTYAIHAFEEIFNMITDDINRRNSLIVRPSVVNRQPLHRFVMSQLSKLLAAFIRSVVNNRKNIFIVAVMMYLINAMVNRKKTIKPPGGYAVNYDSRVINVNTAPVERSRFYANYLCRHETYMTLTLEQRTHHLEPVRAVTDVGTTFESALNHLRNADGVSAGAVYNTNRAITVYDGPGYMLAVDDSFRPIPTTLAPIREEEEIFDMNVSEITLHSVERCRLCGLFFASDNNIIESATVNANVIEDAINLCTASPPGVIISRINNRAARWANDSHGNNTMYNADSFRYAMQIALERSAYLNGDAQTRLLEAGCGRVVTNYRRISLPILVALEFALKSSAFIAICLGL